MNWTGKKIYGDRLEQDERKHLKEMFDSGRGSKENCRRAYILLLSDQSRSDGCPSDAENYKVLEIGISTVEWVRKQCVM